MSSEHDKNEPSRFLGEGVSFKAKLIGILEVSEARGDRMCQEALADLKMAIRAAGEHKQRITINIAIDGLRLRDEKTGDSLYHHPVHKISFIAQDMTDSRAFGYIFGSPDTGHRFFGIKTDKAASQVVIAMRDLFQVVFELKKKEIELAKQHIEQKNRFGGSVVTGTFSDFVLPSAKSQSSDSKVTSVNESKSQTDQSTRTNQSGEAIADLVDLELELNSIQQGIHQMERITPSDPFGPSKDDPFNTDPFGDSFTSFPPKPFLPPPPSSKERSSRTSSESTNLFSPKTKRSLDQDTSLFSEEPSNREWFTATPENVFEEPSPKKSSDTSIPEKASDSVLSQFDVFTELDPLGTGRSKPYIDKKLFFQELKNPPKKVLKDMASEPATTEATIFTTSFGGNSVFQTDPFANDDPFDKTDPFADFARGDPFNTDFVDDCKSNKSEIAEKFQPLFPSTLSKSPNKPNTLEKQMSVGSSPRAEPPFTKQNTFDIKFQFEKRDLCKFNQLHENPSLDMSSESESVPEPPPRPTTNVTTLKPPPLPPKKQVTELTIKPPPRPPHTEDTHYEYVDTYESGTNAENGTTTDGPPLPVPVRKSRFDNTDFSSPPQRPKKPLQSQFSEDEYLTPVQKQKETNPVLLPPPSRKDARKVDRQSESKTPAADTSTSVTPDTLDITLSQLTLSGLNELATKLNIPASQLSNMTLVQLTNFLSNYCKTNSTTLQSDTFSYSFPAFKADFSANFNDLDVATNKSSDSYDRYAVFRELIQQEEKSKDKENKAEEDEAKPQEDIKPSESSTSDKYAALRDIVVEELVTETVQVSIEDRPSENEQEKQQNDLNQMKETSDNVNDKFITEDKETSNITEYGTIIDTTKELNKSPTMTESHIKSPVPGTVNELIQTNNHLNSGSLSDAATGSSPEMDNGIDAGDRKEMETENTAWAIFDSPNVRHSEEGVSPWSSDSKEFGNGSPSGWRSRGDSGSGGEHWAHHHKGRDVGSSERPYSQGRRSTDSYDEEWYESERPRRRTKQTGSTWGRRTGGQSSSSRDVSPWDDEQDECWPCRPRPYWNRRRRQNSWDDDDDYEYEKEHNRFRWSGPDNWDGGEDANWPGEHRHRKEGRWCCPDWDHGAMDGVKYPDRYGSRWESKWRERERKHAEEDGYYRREHSQDSPWEDDYSNDPDEVQSPCYLTAKRNWKRPSSASETERKSRHHGQYHTIMGGSDGERERRYKAGRRSRSKDSEFLDQRYKPDSVASLRYSHRKYGPKSQFSREPDKMKPELRVDPKSATMPGRRKKEFHSSQRESDRRHAQTTFENDFISPVSDSPIKVKTRFNFDSVFDSSEVEPSAHQKLPRQEFDEQKIQKLKSKQTSFDPDIIRSRHKQQDKRDSVSPRFQTSVKQVSLFEDDFSPTDKTGPAVQFQEDAKTSRISEETIDEEEVTFSKSAVAERNRKSKQILSRNRNSFRGDVNLKKSESVNIFARENDPFDDEFFSGHDNEETTKQDVDGQKASPRAVTELKWSENFNAFGDTEEQK